MKGKRREERRSNNKDKLGPSTTCVKIVKRMKGHEMSSLGEKQRVLMFLWMGEHDG